MTALTQPPAPTGDDSTSPAPAEQDADQVLLQRARSTADVLTGLTAAGMLHRVGQPQHLPHLLWPDLDPAIVQEIWDAGAAAGYYAGTRTSGNRWTPEQLDTARDLLRDAGYTGMGRAVEAAAYAAPSRHRPPAPAPLDDPAAGRPHPDNTATGRHT